MNTSNWDFFYRLLYENKYLLFKFLIGINIDIVVILLTKTT